MQEFERLDNKKFAYSCLNAMKNKGCLNDAEIQILTNEELCKRFFSCSKFPILSEVSLNGLLEESDCYDEHGRQRYYKDKVYIMNRAFVVSNHWYGPNKSMPDNRTPFLNWVLDKIK
jgi:hypothetical protein